jgi:alpha-acetolactate decarboxylase
VSSFGPNAACVESCHDERCGHLITIPKLCKADETTSTRRPTFDSRTMVASIPNDIFQFSTWTAVQKGFNTGQPRAEDLTSHGTDGIGVFENGDLMILLDSQAYVVSQEGNATPAMSNDRLCFAMVTVFQPLRLIKLAQEDTMSFAGLKQLLASTDALPMVGGMNTMLPFIVKGTFTGVALTMKNSSQSRQVEKVKGTLFGYKIPSWMEGISGPSMHCHLMGAESDDGGLAIGGKVESFETVANPDIGVGKCGRFHLGFPQGEDWESVNLA